MVKDNSTRKWESQFALVAAAMMPKTMLTEAVWVDIAAIFDRPQAMLFQYKKTGLYKFPEGLIRFTSKPDIDNIRKSVQDAMKAHWTDDRLVCIGKTVKAYREITGKPRVSVRIRTATDKDVERAVYSIENQL